ncbi:MAG: DUF885 domain-containing protein [Frankiaceae bacterium]|nr:DUF885 domain-containing protein [Arenimonas sp.]
MIFRTLALCLLLLAPTAQAAPDAKATAALYALFDADYQRQLREDPLGASYLGEDRYNDKMPDLSSPAMAVRQQAVRDSRQTLLGIDRKALSEADQLNYDIYLLELDQSIAGLRFHDEFMPVSHQGGVHTFADGMLQGLRFEKAKDYSDWIARLRAYGTYTDQTIALMRQGMASGWMRPKAIMQRVPAQIAGQIVAAPEDSASYSPFKAMSANVSASEQERLRAEAKAAVVDVVLPALKRFQSFFNEQYLPKCRDSVAAGELPDGKAYYDFLARSYTTTDLSAAQIHEIGLKEVTRLRAEMEKIRVEVAFHGDQPAFFEYLRSDAKFHYNDGAQLLMAYRAMAKRIDPELTRIFGTLPRAPYGVTPIPDALAPDTTTAYYNGGSTDGKRAGNYYVNLYKPQTRLIWEMLPLTLHESVPGHHLQISIANELPEQPMFRRLAGFTAYVEGWALYAEQLGYDMGLYADPYDRMGQKAYEMWRAVRLVVDTGMHAQGWSRQQAIDYFKANDPKSEHDITNEIDRYLATPGQALAYKIGQMKISELRAKAKAKLGDNFDLRAFHDELLGAGALPLSVLETRMNAWLDAQPAGAK